MKECLSDLNEKLDLIEKDRTLRIIIKAYMELCHKHPKYPKDYFKRKLEADFVILEKDFDRLWLVNAKLHIDMLTGI